MTDKTLYERMREAADVLVEYGYQLNVRPDPALREFSANALRIYADDMEREDAEKAAAAAAHDAQVEELAEWLCNSTLTPWTWAVLGQLRRDYYRDIARDLIAAGWRKAES